MGPYTQLSGGNGCCGALCHVNASVLARGGRELCPKEPSFRKGKISWLLSLLTLGMEGCQGPLPSTCVPLWKERFLWHLPQTHISP